MNAHKLLDLLAGILFIVAFVPYIKAIISTRHLPIGHPDKAAPKKSSWIIWASLDTITFTMMALQHSLNGQIIGAIIGAWVVAGLAVKYGEAGWRTIDKVCLVGGVVGVGLWLTLDDPMLALAASLSSTFLASVPTFIGAYRNPKGEDLLAWTIFWSSCLVAIVAVPKWTIEDAAQPITFGIIETIMMFLLVVVPRLRRTA